MKINISKPKLSPTIKTFRDLSHYDKDTFCLQLLTETEQLNKILTTDNVDEQVDKLTSTVIKCLDSCTPMTTKVIRRPPGLWLIKEIRDLMNARKAAQAVLKTDRLSLTLQNR